MLETTEKESHSPGIIGSVRRLAETGLAIVQNRLELIAVEFREEKGRVVGLLVWGGALVFMAFLALTSIMLTLAVLYREQALYVFGGFAAFFVIGSIVSLVLLRSKLKSPPFGETISQLKKDRQWLKTGKQ
ncbi:MAG: rane protein [Verrucomicrobiales bacterium]|nr:rane protein [Verrucomicrobiales bacterium]